MNKYNKIFFCCLSVVLIFVSMCPSAFASETQYDVIFPFAEPYVSDNQGYIVYECKDSNGNFSYFLYYITCFPVDYANESNNSPVSTPMFTVLAPSVSGNVITFNVAVRMDNQYSYFAQGTFYYISGQPYYQDPVYQSSGGSLVSLSYGIPSKQTLTNYYCRGPWQTQGGVVPFDPTLKVGFLGDDSNYYNQLQEIINKLSILHSDNTDLINKFVSVINALSTLHTDNVEQTTKLAELITLLIENNSDNDQMLIKLADLLADTNSLVDITDSILTYCKIYLPNIEEVLWYIDNELFTVIEKLDKIIEILESSGESNLTSPDTSNLDNYYEIEQSLVNNSNVDVSGAVNVQIDHNAMVFTWNLVETIMNSNGKVFGLTLTVLSLGIIALILGR